MEQDRKTSSCCCSPSPAAELLKHLPYFIQSMKNEELISQLEQDLANSKNTNKSYAQEVGYASLCVILSRIFVFPTFIFMKN